MITRPFRPAGDHHAGLAFWPRLFMEEDLVYGTEAAPFVRCPNATDKVFLPNCVHGAVDGAGVCIGERHVVHLLSGVETPAGWSVLTFPDGRFLSYNMTRGTEGRGFESLLRHLPHVPCRTGVTLAVCRLAAAVMRLRRRLPSRRRSMSCVRRLATTASRWASS
jgi:hypothetical protein